MAVWGDPYRYCCVLGAFSGRQQALPNLRNFSATIEIPSTAPHANPSWLSVRPNLRFSRNSMGIQAAQSAGTTARIRFDRGDARNFLPQLGPFQFVLPVFRRYIMTTPDTKRPAARNSSIRWKDPFGNTISVKDDSMPAIKMRRKS